MALNNLGLGIVFRAKDMASNVMGQIGQNMIGLDQTVAKSAEGIAKNMKLSTDVVVTSLKGVGKGLALATAGFIGLKVAAGTVAGAAELQDTMAQIQQKTGFADEKIKDLTKDFLTLSATLPLSAQELAKVGVIAGQLGIQTASGIKALAFQASQLARTTDFTEETGAAALARLSKLFKVPIEEAAKIGSSLTVLGDTTTATGQGIFEITKRVAGLARTFGLSLAETNAFSATLIDAGVASEAGGSAMSKILLLMTSRTGAFAKQLGISEGEFKKLFGRAPAKALQRFFASFEGLDKFKITKKLKELGINSVRIAPAIFGLASQTKGLAKNLRASTEAFRDGVAMQKAFDALTKSLNAKLDTFGGSLKNVAITIGLELIPALSTAVDLGVAFLALVLKIPAPIRNLAVGVGIIGSAAASIGGVALALKFLVPFLVKAGGGIFLVVFGKVLVVLGLISIAVIALQKAWTSNFLGIREAIVPVIEKISLAFRSLIALFSDGEISGALAEDLTRAENEGVLTFVESVSKAGVKIGKVFDEVSTALDPIIDGFKLIEEFGEGTTEILSSLVGTFASSMNAILALMTGNTTAAIRSAIRATNSMIRAVNKSLDLSAKATAFLTRTDEATVRIATDRFKVAEIDELAFAGLTPDALPGSFATTPAPASTPARAEDTFTETESDTAFAARTGISVPASKPTGGGGLSATDAAALVEAAIRAGAISERGRPIQLQTTIEMNSRTIGEAQSEDLRDDQARAGRLSSPIGN